MRIQCKKYPNLARNSSKNVNKFWKFHIRSDQIIKCVLSFFATLMLLFVCFCFLFFFILWFKGDRQVPRKPFPRIGTFPRKSIPRMTFSSKTFSSNAFSSKACSSKAFSSKTFSSNAFSSKTSYFQIEIIFRNQIETDWFLSNFNDKNI